MRILRFVGVAIVALIGLGLVGWVVFNQVSRWQTKKSLALQAAEIAAHRDAQRATPAAATVAAPIVTATATTPATPSVTPSATPPSPPASPAIALSNGWSGFRGARRDGHYSAGPIRTDWTTLRPLWRQPVGG
jgi:hypothetical protein